MPAEFKPARAGDLGDLELLPKRFDLFAAEMRALLSDIIVPAIRRVEGKLDDVIHRVARLERDQTHVERRLAAIEAKRRKARKT